MSAATPNPPGTFCWAELGTSDMPAGSTFYSELLGWSAQEESAGDAGTYTMFRLGDKSVAGGRGLSPPERADGVPPHWNAYVMVEDADRALARATELGATVIVEPFEVMEHGRMGFFADPTGAGLAVWQPKAHGGYELRETPGSVGWNELMTRDRETAVRFYREMFGWGQQDMDMGPAGTYTVFTQGERQVGGTMNMPAEIPDFVPPHWLVYFQVADCDAVHARAKALGGQGVVDPMDIPNIGRFAVLTDGQGATFAVIQIAKTC